MTTSLAHWDPFAELRGSMDRVFDGSLRPAARNGFRQPSPALNLNVSESNDAYFIEAAVPGVKPEDVEIKVEDNVLTITGSFATREEVDDERYIRREISSGRFERSLRLGPTIDVDKVEASFKNGLLSLTLPKRADAKARTIKVSTK
jgi:HSP20 family protein